MGGIFAACLVLALVILLWSGAKEPKYIKMARLLNGIEQNLKEFVELG